MQESPALRETRRLLRLWWRDGMIEQGDYALLADVVKKATRMQKTLQKETEQYAEKHATTKVEPPVAEHALPF